MKFLPFLMVICVVFLVSAGTTGVAPTTATAVATITDSSVTADSVISNIGVVVKMIDGLKTGSITLILLIAAIIKLIISLLRLPALAGIFNTPKVKPLKPYIALALGMLSGFIASISTGQSLLVSIISGLAAGFGATGIHETLKSLRGKNV